MTTIIFLASLAIMSVMIVSKAVEIRIGRIHFFSHLFRMWDEMIHNFTNSLIFKYNRYRKISQIFVFEFLPSYIYEVLTRLKDYVSKKYYSYSVGDGMRGRRVLRSNGSVSFFLERLADDKTSIDSRKI